MDDVFIQNAVDYATRHQLRLAERLGFGIHGIIYVAENKSGGGKTAVKVHRESEPYHRECSVYQRLQEVGVTEILGFNVPQFIRTDDNLLVIEHDLEMIAAADYVVDFGPGAGRQGGQIVAQGTPAQVAATPQSLTGQFLSGAARIAIPARRRRSQGPYLTIHEASQHNLQKITVQFPLRSIDGAHGMLLALTGVSGSGKSTLMFDILDRAARQRFFGAAAAPGAHRAISGWEHLDKIITIDQTPIGRSTRSNAATYTDAFTPIRQAFAAQPAAKEQGLTAQHFSFNTDGGCCERCQGAGVLDVEMHFLPNVEVRCPACRGRRFGREVLAVKYNGCDIAQVLDLTIAEALPLFAGVPAVRAKLALMVETGLGYLPLGQPASTFSGGEAQRVKLARELARRGSGRTLYLLDEPTTGLHPADTAHLLLLLQRLVEAGNTVIVIEHNLDVIKVADWVIDLGPEGGAAGGRVIAEGAPEEVAAVTASYTGALLRAALSHAC